METGATGKRGAMKLKWNADSSYYLWGFESRTLHFRRKKQNGNAQRARLFASDIISGSIRWPAAVRQRARDKRAESDEFTVTLAWTIAARSLGPAFVCFDFSVEKTPLLPNAPPSPSWARRLAPVMLNKYKMCAPKPANEAIQSFASCPVAVFVSLSGSRFFGSKTNTRCLRRRRRKCDKIKGREFVLLNVTLNQITWPFLSRQKRYIARQTLFRRPII